MIPATLTVEGKKKEVRDVRGFVTISMPTREIKDILDSSEALKGYYLSTGGDLATLDGSTIVVPCACLVDKEDMK
jgi:hypothetical protein